MRKPEYMQSEVETVANAVVNESIGWDPDENSSMSSYPGYFCKFCKMESIEKIEDIRHDLDCPVLVARDLLT